MRSFARAHPIWSAIIALFVLIILYLIFAIWPEWVQSILGR